MELAGCSLCVHVEYLCNNKLMVVWFMQDSKRTRHILPRDSLITHPFKLDHVTDIATRSEKTTGSSTPDETNLLKGVLVCLIARKHTLNNTMLP